MAENNKFQELMQRILNIKAIAIIAVAGAVLTASISFFKTVNEGYNLFLKKDDTGLISEAEFKVNDTLTIKGTVDLLALIENLAANDTEIQEGGVIADLRVEASNPHITWIAGKPDWYYEDVSGKVFEDKTEIDYFFGSCSWDIRKGYCILTNNGEPIYTELRSKIEPGVWSVTYCNSAPDGYRIFISSEGDGADLSLGGTMVPSIFEGKARVILIKSSVPKSDGEETIQGDHFWTYTIEIPKKKKLTITEYGLVGTHGSSTILKLE